MKGVEVDLDIVVAADAVAIGERRVHRVAAAVWLEGANPEVDRRRRVPDEHLSRIGSRPLVDRRVERESGEPRDIAPLRLVEDSVDPHLAVAAFGLGRPYGCLI